MALKLRPSGIGSGIDKDRQDYTVYTGGWDIGRIYEVRGGNQVSRKSRNELAKRFGGRCPDAAAERGAA